ncbi:MAG: Rieske 2Fe-2S domain-containing protein [Gammaproteobacteria bacterium]|nr:Rieske 2Fe-2S domain-containing protein [Gammaproteobacteria bacterium]
MTLSGAELWLPMPELQEFDELPRPLSVQCASLGGPPAGTHLCTLSELRDGNAVRLEFNQGQRVRRIFIVATADGCAAYVNACPHFNIPLNFGKGTFLNYTGERLLCVHHCARFRIDDGYCDAGPCAGHWLTPVAVQLEGDDVYAA